MSYLEEGAILSKRYQIGKILGQGGFGITYEAIDLRLGVRVAIKEYFPREYVRRAGEGTEVVCLPGEENQRFYQKGIKRFLDEAYILGKFLDEPAVVDVKDVFEENQTAYMVMEYIEGMTLKQYRKKQGVLEINFLLEKLFPLMEMLERIHQEKLIHRDLTPENIMVRAEREQFVLIDFGTTRDYTDRANTTFAAMGKEGYAPPEQCRPGGNIGPWTDVYGICATIYYCITGRVPEDSRQRALVDELPMPSELGVPLTPEQEKILKKGLSLLWKQRYPDMESLREALEKTVPEREIPKEKKKRPVWPKVAVGLGIAAVVALVLTGVLYFREKYKFRGIQTQQIILTASEDMKASEYYKAVDIVEERLKIFAGDGGYRMRTEDEQIWIELPVETFAGEGSKYAMEGYVASPFGLEAAEWKKVDGYYKVLEERCPVEPEDIQSVGVKTGKVPGVKQREEYPFSVEEDYRYLELELTGEKSRELKETFGKNRDELILIQDQRDEQYYYYELYPGEKENLWYCVDTTQAENYMETVAYGWTQESFEGHFTVQSEYVGTWQKKEDTYYWGENQREPEKFSGNTAVLKYEVSPELTEGEWANLEIDFKKRLDALETPYAFGRAKKEKTEYGAEREGILVRLDPRATGNSINEVLSGSFEITTRWGEYENNISLYGDMTLEIQEDGVGNYQLIYQEQEDYDISEIQEKTERILKNGGEELLLQCSGSILASAELTEPITDGRIVFDRFFFKGHEKIQEEQVRLLQTIVTAEMDTELPTGVSLLDNAYMVSETGEMLAEEIPWGITLTLDKMEEVLEEIPKRYKGVGCYGSLIGVRSLYVNLNLPVEEGFPEKAAAMAEEIYREYELDDGWIEHVIFYLTKEDNSTQERARIIFNEEFMQEEVQDMYVTVIFTNGRMEEYKKEMQQCIEDSPFYQEKLKLPSSRQDYSWPE